MGQNKGLTSPRIRLLLLTLVPLVFSAVVMSALVTVSTEQRLTTQSDYFTKTLTSYLAMTTAEHLINDDVLGINILLTRLHEDKVLDFASVYGTDNQLIAQVGRQDSAVTAVFSREVAFQDTAAGYIQVGFNDHTISQYRDHVLGLVLLFHLVLITLVIGTILFAGDFVALWVFRSPTPQDKEPENSGAETAGGIDVAEPVDPGAAILVIKLRPVRLLNKYKSRLEQAVALYGGKLSDHGDDLTAQFHGSGGVVQVSRAALLLLTLIHHLGPPLKLKLGIHWLPDAFDDLELEKATKHTSYLASIGEQVALVSRALEEQLVQEPEITCDPFHSSLTPDGEVFQITRVKNQSLIDSQALQLINER